MNEEKRVAERVVLVGLNASMFDESEQSDEETLDELEELAETAGGICVAKVLQRRDSPDPATFIGQGKVEEVAALAADNACDLVIFDNDLSPSQLKNLEERLGVPVLDRTALILDIFAMRASTSEGRLQVALAQYRYILSKLTGLGKSLSRLGGGIGTRGPGESKLETDRRHIRRHIHRLEEEFEEIRRVRSVQREKRIKSAVPTAAIVGYTNAGKSTLLNKLTGSSIGANDRLFDTLDPSARKLELDDRLTVVFTDTVGFIRKLPHRLIEAFKATLEELEYADLILHVIDLSNPAWIQQAAVVDELIEELGIGKTPCIRVYNKMDAARERPVLRGGDVLISAKYGTNLDQLLESVRRAVTKPQKHVWLELPYGHSGWLDTLYRETTVDRVDYLDEHIAVELHCDEAFLKRLYAFKVRTVNGAGS